MKGKPLKIVSITLALVLMLTLMIGCDEKEDDADTTSTPEISTPVAETTATASAPTPKLSGTLTVFHAGSLAVPFAEMEEEFEEMHPGVDVQCESASSGVTIRKVTELGKNAEIIASADYSLIPDLMYPKFANWYMTFAKNRMVLCYTDESQYADEVNSDNWFDILLQDGVEYGHSDLLDPCGYRTLLVWQLAEKHYDQPGLYDNLMASCPEKNIRPKSVQLVSLLQSGDLDYASEYSSVAMQHDLKYVEFPPEIDLSSVQFKDSYAQSTVDIPGKEPSTTITQLGKPIVYGVTMHKNTANPELAVAFMEYLLGEQGQAIMNHNGQPSIVPAACDDLSKLPAELKPLAVQQPTSKSPQTVTIVDQLGVSSVLPSPCQRVVVLMHHALDIVYELGGGEQVVGVLEGWPRYLPASFKDIAPGLGNISTPGDLKTVNMEELLKLDPDVVIVTHYAPEEMKDQIRNAGIPVVSISLYIADRVEASKLNPNLDDPEKAYTDGIIEGISIIGEILGRQTKAEQLIAYMLKNRDLVTERLGELSRKDRVRCYMANRDLGTYGTGKYTGVIMQKAGGLDVAEEIVGYKQVNMEQVLLWNPEVIFVQERYKSLADEIAQDASWQPIDAVEKGAIYISPEYVKPWGHPCPESIALGELWMAKKLYPDKFDDIDMQTIVDEFYRTFYGIPYNGNH